MGGQIIQSDALQLMNSAQAVQNRKEPIKVGINPVFPKSNGESSIYTFVIVLPV
jgi:hypothetical protein